MGRRWGGSGRRLEEVKHNNNMLQEFSVKIDFSCVKYTTILAWIRGKLRSITSRDKES